MRRAFHVSAGLAAVGAVPLVIVLIVFPHDRSRALDVFVVFLGALVLLGLVRLAGGEGESRRPSLFDAPEPEEPEVARIAELDRLERDVYLATGSELQQHVRIKPLLRDVVEHRLWSHRGIDLSGSPERAEKELGSEVYELIKAGELDPNARYLRGLDLAALGRVLDRIEAI